MLHVFDAEAIGRLLGVDVGFFGRLDGARIIEQRLLCTILDELVVMASARSEAVR